MPTPSETRPGNEPAGGFATTFTRRNRVPIRPFLPGRRAWTGAAAAAGAVLLLGAIGIGYSRIPLDPGGKTSDATAPHPRHLVGAPTPTSSGTRTHGASPAPHHSGGGTHATRTTEAVGAPSAAAAGGTRTTPPPPAAHIRARATASPTASPTNPLSVRTSVDSGGNAYWSQNIVTVTTTEPLSALKVAIRINQSGGVTNAGTWDSLGDKASVSTGSTSTELNYMFVLKPGITLPAGRYVFEAQYNHPEGAPSLAHDLYEVVATAADTGKQWDAAGHFS